MAPPLPVTRTAALPVELAHSILYQAWFSLLEKEWPDRWNLYRDFSLVSHSWREVMSSVAFRCVMIQTAKDFKVYQKLIKKRWGVDPSSKTVERVAPAAHDFFRRSDLHIMLSDWTCQSSLGITFATDYARIPNYVPSSKHISVTIKELPSSDRNILPYRPLFDLLEQYPDTQDVYLLWTYTHINRYLLPQNVEVRGITYLRLHEHPRCVCHNTYHPAGHKHESQCFSYHLPSVFKDLQHLHLDTPYILKCLNIPPSVTQLTLEAPPIYYLASLGHFSSLMGWNIVSALSLGLFKPGDDSRARRRKIVVNAGSSEPIGWKQVLAACEAHDVELELRHVYPLKDNTPSPR
ncbi:hypothetical protein PYCCODRAFT_1445227 [Trametes coccinea BRFM310]|uniref:F-box domain-containing protein n=1 Tax=Trametes coccinea (strain BRFM310) TaxID=1353009 RepID=A0A1Y2INT7_TRAC3|nr:hypothetical protein PYCCODRAFT_1445227 [Trametes coccinea BRFM310]